MSYSLTWPVIIQRQEDFPSRRRIYICEADKAEFSEEDPQKELYKITITKNDKQITEIIKPQIRPDLAPDQKGQFYFAGDNLPKLKGCRRGDTFQITNIQRYPTYKRPFFWIWEFIIANLIESIIVILLIVNSLPESWKKTLHLDKNYLFLIACFIIILPRIQAFIKNWKK